MNTYKNLILSLLTLILQGCGTQYAYNQSELEVFEAKDLTLTEFIREKIIDSEHAVTKAFKAALNPLTEVTAFMGKGMSIRQKEAYNKENFIYKANFDYRYHALLKPKNDIEMYCKAKGGKLKVISLNKQNLTDGKYANSLQAYVNVMKSNVEGLKSEIQIAPDISLPIYTSKEEMASYYAEMVEANNVRSGIYEAQKSIDRAINEQAFGEFSCLKEQKSLWSVNIIPFRLTSGYGLNRDKPIYTLSIGIIPLVSTEESSEAE